MESITMESLRKTYPNEWVLLANPQMDENELEVLHGIPLYHSRDKREVCYLGKPLTLGYQSITLIYTGVAPKIRRTGVFKRIAS
jgi:hypothetical protein